MTSYLFYDIETTGLHTAFDQILRFAAVRTDTAFQELESLALDVKLRCDVVPGPGAVLTHGIDVSRMHKGSRELEAVTRIHRWVNAPGTVSLGYNTLSFDDEVLRFSFHRNLLPPYTHQYSNGCRRMDLYPMVVLFRLYRPEALTWPETGGKPSLKLEHLNAANGLDPGVSHNAMHDVRATLALARKLAGHHRMWDFLCGGFHKSTDLQRMERLPVRIPGPKGGHRLAVMVAGDLGPDQEWQAPVLSMGSSVPYGNQTLWLRLDLPELRTAQPETVDTCTRAIRKKAGEPGILLPPLERYWKRIDGGRRNETERNIEWIRAHPELFARIVQWHREYRYPEVPEVDADAALYPMGFPSHRDQERCRRFHRVPPPEKVKMASSFSRPDLQELARRVIWRNYPEAAPRAWQPAMEDWLRRINPPSPERALVDHRGVARTTPAAAMEEVRALLDRVDLTEAHRSLLAGLAGYLSETFGVALPAGHRPGGNGGLSAAQEERPA
jgi:exodeoxyribonuclease-1